MQQKRRLEKELKIAGDKNKNAVWALLLSLLALITTFQKNYHNYQLVRTPNEMASRYLTISRRRRREYRRIVTETKSRWLFANIHVAWGD